MAIQNIQINKQEPFVGLGGGGGGGGHGGMGMGTMNESDRSLFGFLFQLTETGLAKWNVNHLHKTTKETSNRE